jgi:hypothetical protein
MVFLIYQLGNLNTKSEIEIAQKRLLETTQSLKMLHIS